LKWGKELLEVDTDIGVDQAYSSVVALSLEVRVHGFVSSNSLGLGSLESFLGSVVSGFLGGMGLFGSLYFLSGNLLFSVGLGCSLLGFDVFRNSLNMGFAGVVNGLLSSGGLLGGFLVVSYSSLLHMLGVVEFVLKVMNLLGSAINFNLPFGSHLFPESGLLFSLSELTYSDFGFVLFDMHVFYSSFVTLDGFLVSFYSSLEVTGPGNHFIMGLNFPGLGLEVNHRVVVSSSNFLGVSFHEFSSGLLSLLHRSGALQPAEASKGHEVISGSDGSDGSEDSDFSEHCIKYNYKNYL
jgi:hypothetical protein